MRREGTRSHGPVHASQQRFANGFLGTDAHSSVSCKAPHSAQGMQSPHKMLKETESDRQYSRVIGARAFVLVERCTQKNGLDTFEGRLVGYKNDRKSWCLPPGHTTCHGEQERRLHRDAVAPSAAGGTTAFKTPASRQRREEPPEQPVTLTRTELANPWGGHQPNHCCSTVLDIRATE